MSCKIHFGPNKTRKAQRFQFLYHNSSDSPRCIVTWGEKENSYSISQGFRHRRIYYASFSSVTNGLEAHNSAMTLPQLSRSQIRWLTSPWHDRKMESPSSTEAGARGVENDHIASKGLRRKAAFAGLKTQRCGRGWFFLISDCRGLWARSRAAGTSRCLSLGTEHTGHGGIWCECPGVPNPQHVCGWKSSGSSINMTIFKLERTFYPSVTSWFCRRY